MVTGAGMRAGIITTSMLTGTTKSTIAVIMDTAHDMVVMILDTAVADMPIVTIIMDHCMAGTVTPVQAWSSSTSRDPAIIDMTTD